MTITKERLDELLEMNRWIPKSSLFAQASIEELCELAIASVAWLHIFATERTDKSNESNIHFWSYLLGSALQDVAVIRRNDPILGIGADTRSWTPPISYIESVQWACDQLIEYIDDIHQYEAML